MSDKKQMPFEEFNWFEIQKKYMDALAAFNSPNPFAGSAAFKSGNPFEQLNPFMQPSKPTFESFWVNAMNDWWKSVKPETTNEHQELFGKVLEQCRNYYFMSEQFSKLIEGIAEVKGKHQDIIEFINQQFNEMESALMSAQGNFSWSNLIDSCEQPIELMKNAFSNMSSYSGDAFNDMNPEVKKLRERFLSVPGLGYSREAQDKFQELIRLWAGYQDNYQEYQTVMTQLNHDSLEVMRKRIIAMSKKDEDINSMKQVYDLWVESNEKVYGEYVFTDEYAELNGRLVNSLMAFKKKSHEITEDILAAMNMPTTRAIDALEKRQYDIRKQIKTMQAELKQLKSQVKQAKTSVTENTTVKKTVTASRSKKKKVKKSSAKATSAKVVEFKPSKKKAKKKAGAAKKKSKRRTVRSSSNDKGMIELKF